jgi:hypothetical protein
LEKLMLPLEAIEHQPFQGAAPDGAPGCVQDGAIFKLQPP